MNAKLVSQITGVSIRTLHHYDEIGLLCPKRNPENDYREYTENDLDTLQQILFFKECGFKLVQIKEILTNPAFDRLEAYELQKSHLHYEKNRIEAMIETINKSIQNMKGEITMSKKDKFKGFDFSNNPYEEEARKLWGREAIDKSNARVASLNAKEKSNLEESMNNLFRKLAEVRHLSPTSKEVQSEIAKMYDFFNSNFGYTYTLEAFAGLGQMYVDDDRFTKNIDAFGEGLSQFLALAMATFAQNSKPM